MSKKKSPKKTKHKFPKMLEEETPAAEASAPEESSSELNLEFAEDDEAVNEGAEVANEDGPEIDDATLFADDSEIEAIADEAISEQEMALEAEDAITDDSSDDAEDGEVLRADDEVSDDEAVEEPAVALDDTELGDFEAAPIEDVDALPPEQLRSIVESILFMTDKPISIAVIKQSFKGTNVKSKDIRETLTTLSDEYASSARGFTLDEIAGGFQLRTKVDNIQYLRGSVKARPFKLSGPALEVLSIVAYKQPTTKHQIDEIRGVESGHLLRALMEKHLLSFGERSDLPGKPMFYETTRKFLEIFSLRNLSELPSLHEIDQLIPEGIGDEPDKKKETLSDLTGELSQEVASSYSVGEEELLKITDELSTITTSSEFFEQEKQRQKDKRDSDRAQDIREKQIVGEEVEAKDARWLERYDAAKAAGQAISEEVDLVSEVLTEEPVVAEEPQPEPPPREPEAEA